MPRCDSGLPRKTLNGTGFTGNVSERPLAQEGLSFTIFNNSIFFNIILLGIETRYYRNGKDWYVELMSIYNDIKMERTRNAETCEMNSVTVANYARRFLLGRWSFLGPGSVKKWHGNFF